LIYSFLAGFLIGAVSLLGLAYGMRFLFWVQSDKIPKEKTFSYSVYAFILLIGQFFAAAGLAWYFSSTIIKHGLFAAAGLMIAIFGLLLFVRNMDIDP